MKTQSLTTSTTAVTKTRWIGSLWVPTHVILGVHQDGGALGCSHGYGSSGRLQGKALSRVGQQGKLGEQPTAGGGGGNIKTKQSSGTRCRAVRSGGGCPLPNHRTSTHGQFAATRAPYGASQPHYRAPFPLRSAPTSSTETISLPNVRTRNNLQQPHRTALHGHSTSSPVYQLACQYPMPGSPAEAPARGQALPAHHVQHARCDGPHGLGPRGHHSPQGGHEAG